MNISDCHRGCAVFQRQGIWVDGDAKVMGQLFGIFHALNGAKWALDPDLVSFLTHMGLTNDPEKADETGNRHPDEAQPENHEHNGEDDSEGALGRTGGLW